MRGRKIERVRIALHASAKRHSSLSQESRMGAAIGRGRKLFACEVVKNTSAGVAHWETSGHPGASGLSDRYLRIVFSRASSMEIYAVYGLSKRERVKIYRWTKAQTRRIATRSRCNRTPASRTDEIKFTFPRDTERALSNATRCTNKGGENYYIRVHKSGGSVAVGLISLGRRS